MPKENYTKSIPIVMRLLKREARNFKQPIVTDIAARNESPFLVLISCILSLRTRDETTEKAAERLFALADNPKSMLSLSAKQIERSIYPVGFYRTKAKRIKGICKKLLDEYNGKVPADFEELMKFKGIGRKTANIVMVYGFNEPGLPIDTHCHRIPNRLGWINTKTPEKTEEELKKILPRKYWHDFNDLFVQFGQNICKPVGPRCGECPINKYCKYYREVYRKKLP